MRRDATCCVFTVRAFGSHKGSSSGLPFLFSQHEPLDGRGFTGLSIAFNENSTQARITFGSFKSSWQAGEEALEYLLFLYADYAVKRPAHAYIRLIRGAVGQYPVICCGDMRMSAQNRRHTAIEIPPHGDLF